MTTSFRAERSGVYRAPPDIPRIRERALAAGIHWVDVRLDDATDKEALLGRFAQSLGFPPHFGANWDALSDCLQDLPRAEREGYVLHLTAGRTRGLMAAEWSTLLEILSETAMYWKSQGATFVALVDDPKVSAWS